MPELFWLLLPVAFIAGWFIAKRSHAVPSSRSNQRNISHDYFKGLNYLLNEQPDKAIEVFIRLLEVDSETVETHFALGNLYRRRGEVDRAIRIHQNLVARQSLDSQQRNLALLELGLDYMKAGLFDRAESLFKELIDANAHTAYAVRQLIDIYQQEHDWDKAVAMAKKLEATTDETCDQMIAHYYCEQAEQLDQTANTKNILSLIKDSLSIDPDCVRASLMEGKLLMANRDWKAAIQAFKRVEKQDPDYLPETIGQLVICYRHIDKLPELMDYLRNILRQHGGITTMLVLAELIKEQDGEDLCMAFLTEQLHRRLSVRGIDRLVELALERADNAARENLMILKDMTNKLLDGRSIYKCSHCGFNGKSLHWQCPSCKHWGIVKPIQGIEGE